MNKSQIVITKHKAFRILSSEIRIVDRMIALQQQSPRQSLAYEPPAAARNKNANCFVLDCSYSGMNRTLIIANDQPTYPTAVVS